MKIKFFNLLSVFLATSGLLAPAQATFGQSVERQIDLEHAQRFVCVQEAEHFLCEVEKRGDNKVESAHRQNSVKDAKATDSLKSSTDNVVPELLTPDQQGSIANLLIWLSCLLPCGLGLGLFMYDKYRVYRANVLSKQIENLERLWQYGPDNDATTDTGREASG